MFWTLAGRLIFLHWHSSAAPSPTTISSLRPPLLSFLGLPDLPSFLPSHALKPEPGSLPCLASSCPEEEPFAWGAGLG